MRFFFEPRITRGLHCSRLGQNKRFFFGSDLRNNAVVPVRDLYGAFFVVIWPISQSDRDIAIDTWQSASEQGAIRVCIRGGQVKSNYGVTSLWVSIQPPPLEWVANSQPA
jgi:hypothetical protein